MKPIPSAIGDAEIASLLQEASAVTAAVVGNLSEAEALLKTCNGARSARGLDLLARIALKRGDHARAKSLWEDALRIDPLYTPAVEAMAEMRKPWLAIAVSVRIACLLGVAALLAMCAYLAWKLSECTATRHYARVTKEMVRKQTARRSGRVVTIPSSDQYVVSTVGSTTRIVFMEPLFGSHAEISASGRNVVRELGLVLAKMASGHQLLIEGHTDALPPSPSSPFSDNYMLGLCRAAEVARVLTEDAKIPLGTIMIVSKGACEPPYCGENAASDRRNRTVVIMLKPWGKQ